MSGKTTRRAFVGGGVALAAGVGAAKLPDLVTQQRRKLTLDVESLESAGSPPSFGTLLPGSVSTAPLTGVLRRRGSSRIAGRISITSIASDDGMLHVHTLDLDDGTLVALGPDSETELTIASGTRAFSGARGRVTIRNPQHATLALDVDLEL